jgi:hypothetical protein
MQDVGFPIERVHALQAKHLPTGLERAAHTSTPT